MRSSYIIWVILNPVASVLGDAWGKVIYIKMEVEIGVIRPQTKGCLLEAERQQTIFLGLWRESWSCQHLVLRPLASRTENYLFDIMKSVTICHSNSRKLIYPKELECYFLSPFDARRPLPFIPGTFCLWTLRNIGHQIFFSSPKPSSSSTSVWTALPKAACILLFSLKNFSLICSGS